MSEISPKTPSEIVSIDFDFSNVCSSLSSATVTVLWKRGATDSSPEAMLKNGPTITGAVVSQLFQGGLDNADYRITCLADTNEKGGQRFELSTSLLVRK